MARPIILIKNGKLQSGVVVENGICKLYSKDGTLLETGNAQEWSLLGGDYYYLRDGVLLKSGAYRLSDGKWYGFDATGKMRANTIGRWSFFTEDRELRRLDGLGLLEMVLCIISECFAANGTSCDQWN